MFNVSENGPPLAGAPYRSGDYWDATAEHSHYNLLHSMRNRQRQTFGPELHDGLKQAVIYGNNSLDNPQWPDSMYISMSYSNIFAQSDYDVKRRFYFEIGGYK